MTDAEQFTPAKPEDIAQALAHAFQFDGRKRTHRADEIMARTVAAQLVEALERAGFVIMQRPPIRETPSRHGSETNSTALDGFRDHKRVILPAGSATGSATSEGSASAVKPEYPLSRRCVAATPLTRQDYGPIVKSSARSRNPRW
jgi:hypothetical protein